MNTTDTNKGFFARLREMWRKHQLLSLFEKCRRHSAGDYIGIHRNAVRGLQRDTLLFSLFDTKYMIVWRQRFQFKWFYPNRWTDMDKIYRLASIEQCINDCLQDGYLELTPDDIAQPVAVMRGRDINWIRPTSLGRKLSGKSGYISLSAENNMSFWQIILASGLGGITVLFGQTIWEWLS